MRNPRPKIVFALVVLTGLLGAARFYMGETESATETAMPLQNHEALRGPHIRPLVGNTDTATEARGGATDGKAGELLQKLEPRQQAELRALVLLMERMAQKPPAKDTNAVAPSGADEDVPVAAKKRFPVSVPGIREAIQQVKGDLQQCYDAWHALNPDVGGRILPEFTIQVPDSNESSIAKIDEVKIAEGGLGNVFLEGCIRSVFMALHFDVPKSGPVVVRYPLHFDSSRSDVADESPPL